MTRVAARFTEADVERLSRFAPRSVTAQIEAASKPRAAKYGAERTTQDGYSFDSKLEATFYARLVMLRRMGELRYFVRQVPIDLAPGVKHRVDFLVFLNNGGEAWLEVKGFDTPDGKRSRKIAESVIGLPIHVIDRKSARNWTP